MFPAIKTAVREWLQREPTPELQPLDLKASDVTFNQLNVDWYARHGYTQIAESLGSKPNWSGETVTHDSALTHSVVWACQRIISESTAFLPLHLMRSDGETKQPAKKHPLYRILHDEPNEWMSDMEFRESMTHQVVSRGNAYARIIRRAGIGEVLALTAFAPGNCRPEFSKNGRLVYIAKDGGEQEKTYEVRSDKPHEILHIRGLGLSGIEGYSVVSMARNSIGTALAAEHHAAKFYAAGGRLPYLLEHPAHFRTEQDFQRFRADWEATYSGSDGYNKAPILQDGLKYTPIGSSARDAQFLESRLFQIPEICRWFLISPHLVGDLSRATFSNIEHLALEFVKMTLTAWIVRWEKAIQRCLLTPQEKTQGYYAKHNVNGLLRGDFQSRMAGYSTILQNGIGNIDEVRDLEDWNPLPDDAGKAHHIQLNMQTIPGTGKPTTAEAAALAKTDRRPV